MCFGYKVLIVKSTGAKSARKKTQNTKKQGFTWATKKSDTLLEEKVAAGKEKTDKQKDQVAGEATGKTTAVKESEKTAKKPEEEGLLNLTKRRRKFGRRAP